MRTLPSPFSLLPSRGGQALLLVTLAIGGVILGATTIAGLITTYQIRRATDAINSQKAIFAADAGIECGQYRFFRFNTSTADVGCPDSKILTNSARYEMSMNPAAQTITSRGFSQTARRAFQLFLGGL